MKTLYQGHFVEQLGTAESVRNAGLTILLGRLCRCWRLALARRFSGTGPRTKIALLDLVDLMDRVETVSL